MNWKKRLGLYDFVKCNAILYRLLFACYWVQMRIRNILHKGLRKLVEKDDSSGLAADLVPKLRRMISFLQEMSDESELHTIPNWKAHQLHGERKGIWSLHVSKNWRLTFGIFGTNVEIFDLNYEDYH